MAEAGWRRPWNKPWLNLPLLCQQEPIQFSQICKARNLLTSPTKAMTSPSTRKKKGFPKKETNLKADRQVTERDHSSLRRALLRLLFNLTSVDGKSTEDPRNFTKAPRVITLIRNSSGSFKVWDFNSATKEPFPESRVVQVESPELKKLFNNCFGRVRLLLHPSLYRTIKLIFPYKR